MHPGDADDRGACLARPSSSCSSLMAPTTRSSSNGTCVWITAIKADNVTDLFAKLTSENEDVVTEEEEEELDESKPTDSNPKLSDEEKTAKKTALEAKRASKKQERENKS